ncbi:DUF1643 domain-containing protein [Streptomyces sp. NPDC052676]|uniref:DUF1643 domain-containing protein n=1 Tax=Streptomyces sp. NPDC052676 TaxID=3154953 RepID=UPI003415339F
MTEPTDEAFPRRELLCILANPPLRSGERTRGRLVLACDLLGFETFTMRNLFAVPSGTVTDISTLGATADGWAQARKQMESAFSACDGVLLAYGISEPTGAARKYHREQVRWVTERLVASGCQSFQVGDGPRHPSRWQRWTSRHHRELEFSAALEASLEAVSFG